MALDPGWGVSAGGRDQQRLPGVDLGVLEVVDQLEASHPLRNRDVGTRCNEPADIKTKYLVLVLLQVSLLGKPISICCKSTSTAVYFSSVSRAFRLGLVPRSNCNIFYKKCSPELNGVVTHPAPFASTCPVLLDRRGQHPWLKF